MTQVARSRPPGEGVFKRVLVGFDGSPNAQRALREAVAFATELRGELTVLVVTRPSAHAETDRDRDRAIAEEREALTRGLALADLVDVPMESVTADDPGRALADFAREHGFDVIVVGEHGREQLTHRGLGHSLETLLKEHPCPVLVV